MRPGVRDVGASVADLGTLLPIAAGLIVVNGVDAAAALGLAGALFVLSGLYFRVPMPVQPIKAAGAIAIATRASPDVIAAAAVTLGAILLLLALTGAAPVLERIFPKPIIRGNQLGVGLLLVLTSFSMITAGADDAGSIIVFAFMVGGLMATAERRFPVALALVAGGVGWSLLQGAHVSLAASPALPEPGSIRWDDLRIALTLLVIPQIPLTLGNAIVGTADVERQYYGARARRVTPRALLVSSGAANVAVGALGGMPLCHGSSGATAYYRFGARTAAVNIAAGSTLLVAGLFFGETALDVFALIPAPVLGAMLAYTGVRHALLVGDQRGAALVVALAMGIVGGLTRNLTYGMAVGLPAYILLAGTRRVVGARR